MTEPSSTGIGGDMFCLFYDAHKKKVRALNGSGRSSKNNTLAQMRSDLGLKQGESGDIPPRSIHSVTTPGAAAGWVDTVEHFGSGKLSLEQILTPAIELGEEGFPVTELASVFWRESEKMIKKASPNFGEILKSDEKAPDGKRAPLPGEIMKNPTLANTFRLLAKHGKEGFYSGPVAEALVKVVQDLGGHFTMDDLTFHVQQGSEEVEAIKLRFNGQHIGKIFNHPVDGQPGSSADEEGVDVWEHPPNGQGIVALMALGILEELERTSKIPTFQESDHNSAPYLHAIIEALRIAFADGNWFVADPSVSKVPTEGMLSRPYLAERAKLFNPEKASDIISHGSPAQNSCDTVYFAVTDKDGNAASFINSNYSGFGTCIIPQGCGFTLQNRGAGFSLEEKHPNVLAPRKRPYHTIIPALVTNASDGSLHTVYGVMGGFMQPQGHVQVLLNMLTFKYNPQAALDAPRLCIGAGTPDQGKVLDRMVYLEEGIGEDVAGELSRLGHESYLVRWVNVKAECTISWSIQAHKKSIRFGIFKHPGGGVAPTPKLPSSTFEAPPTPGLTPVDANHEPPVQRNGSSAAVEKLKSIGLKEISWHGACEANRVTTGHWDVRQDEGGMYGLVFDNTFSKQFSKTVTFVLTVYPTACPLPRNHQIQGRPAEKETNAHGGRSRIMKIGSRNSSDSISQTGALTAEPLDSSNELQAGHHGTQLSNRGSNFFTGVLHKRRRKRHQGFARRFFSLDFSTSTLSYYHDRNTAAIRGAIPLSLAAIGTNAQTRDISIDSGAEVWHLRALNANDFAAWKHALELARAPHSPISPEAQVRADGGCRSQSSVQTSLDDASEWAKVETLVNRIRESREIARHLAKDTDPRYLPLALPKPRFERKSTASSASESPSEQSLGQSFPGEGERKPFWKRKSSSDKTNAGFFRRSVSTQPITTSSSQSMPSTPNDLAIPGPASQTLASHAEESVHDHCLNLLQNLDSISSEFAILIEANQRRRVFPKPTPVSATSRYSIDTLGDSQEFFDAETGNSSQLLTIQHESDEDGGRLEREQDSDEDSASDVEGPPNDDPAAPQVAATSAYPPKPHSLTPLPAQWVKRRIAVPPPTVLPPSLIGFLRKNVGKDLSTISMPVSANEPLSLLQRASEQLEYSQLLDSAATAASQSSIYRLLCVTAFAISTISYSRVKERSTRKPFNPMLGETFEMVREDRGFRFVAEKVCHRPVRMACQAESEKWTFAQAPMPTQKFWGKSAELITEGRVRVVLHSTGDRFTWTPATCFLRNIIAGEKYVEPVGNMTITNEANGEHAIVTFKSKGMFSGRSEDVVVQTFDSYGDDLSLGLVGKWTSHLNVTENGSPKLEQGPMWQAEELLPDVGKRYGFTGFAAQLNEITALEKGKLAPTDSRLRPDQRLLEDNEFENSEALKGRLEEAQRKRRKEETDEWQPKWFKKVEGLESVEEVWRLNEGPEGYWERRSRGAWAGMERVFDD
ncbi:MAG: hypothetical protein Q9177_002202 [Variospora cf. flavescens]